MAIDFVVVRNKNRTIIGIVDTASSIIWHSKYYGVGDFEIYVVASSNNLSMLKEGNFITRNDSDEIGIIEGTRISDDLIKGTMIVATGRFAKSLLDRRQIYQLSGNQNTPTILRGNVEVAVRNIVTKNAINCSFDTKRNMPQIELGALAGITKKIVDSEGNASEKQVSYQNLLEYTDSVLQEYNMSAKMILGASEKLQYVIYEGSDRSSDNVSGNIPIVFSPEFDNLTSSDYVFDTTDAKNTALIGGEGEGIERFYAVLASDDVGINRREMWVDAQSIARTVKKSELLLLFPTGTFTPLNFTVDGVIYAVLLCDTESVYTLEDLQEAFPDGIVRGTKYIVSGIEYAAQIYGETEKYNLTKRGYSAMLDVEGEEGDFKFTPGAYTKLLYSNAKQQLAQKIARETFNGQLMVSNGNYVFNRDFFLGDLITIQDNKIGKYLNCRIVEATEVQDENGYSVDVVYE